MWLPLVDTVGTSLLFPELPFAIYSSTAPLHWALPSLWRIALRATGAALQSWADSSWVVITSFPTFSGPWSMTDGCGNKNSQLSGLWGRIYTLEISCRIRMSLPSPGLPPRSPCCPVSPVPFPDSPGSTAFINHFHLNLHLRINFWDRQPEKYWLSLRHLKWLIWVVESLWFLHE